ncbi:MAG TPA: chemotaxis protein CheW [Ruminiclostridium sp.]|nr:chemotaxis protein CheW [Clostridiaceae bacterium]HAA24975.1 chemotaxis protein CheW [Ruminiclostridium sp.]
MAILQFVKFRVGDEEFGVDIRQVREINKLQEFFKVPTTPPFIEGLINLRGNVLTVFNLRKRLGMPDKDFDENSKIIVVNYKDFLVGFTVDMVSEIVKVPEEDIENTPPSITGFERRFLSGVAKVGEKLILMLDLENVLSPDEENNIKEFIDENKDSVLEQQ